METEARPHRGYVREGKLYNGEWQVHIYESDSAVAPFPRSLPAIRDANKDRAFARAEQSIDDYLDYWSRRIKSSPALDARRSK